MRTAITALVADAKKKDEEKTAALDRSKKSNKDSKKKSKVFTQTVELQIGLKNYDPQKDKRFSGQVSTPRHIAILLAYCNIFNLVHFSHANIILGQASQPY